uniref:Uncharacterized protein n=1 Tax=Anguilla anguilla TaxID=7936 RepID=A0A0E9U1A2_ANGAN
MCVHVTHMGAG